MSEKYLVKNCAPTLAGLKTGNLFNYTCISDTLLNEEVKKWNCFLNSKGITLTVLRKTNQRYLMYIYRDNKLSTDLNNNDIQSFLSTYGYSTDTTENCIKHLKSRIAVSDEFPHEIGLFLGYPFADVLSFIKNKGQNPKYVGYWKVYHNELTAIKCFNQFKKCKSIYCKLINNGRSINQLTIAA